MRSPRQLLQRVRTATRPESAALTDLLATEADVRAAYRLLLGREPDPEGFRYWCGLVARGLPLESLARGFLGSAEFVARNGMASEPLRVQAAGFVLFARPGDSLYGPHFMTYGEYEPHVAAVVRAHLVPGACFLDVGANIGYFTMLAASLVGAGGRVVAIEAAAENAALCRRSARENEFDQVEVHQVAASDAPGRLVVRTNPVDSNAHLQAVGAGEPVEAVVLDDLLADIDALALVKVDVEGYEPRALAGMSGLLRRFRPPLVVEFNPGTLALAGHPDPAALAELVTALGYVPQVIEPDGSGLTAVAPEALGPVVAARGATHLDVLFSPELDGPEA